MKKKELLARIEALEARVVEVPTAEMDWTTTVDKFKKLEAQIGRIELLERQQTFAQREIVDYQKRLVALDRKLENVMQRITALERQNKPLILKKIKVHHEHSNQTQARSADRLP
jgi:chromosome segregation ATPase